METQIGKAAVLALCLSKTKLALADSAVFVPLGDLPSGPFSSWAAGISSDGSTIVGAGTAFGPLQRDQFEAVRWGAPDFLIEPLLQPYGQVEISSFATAVSAEGRLVFGHSFDPLQAPTLSLPFRWSQASGFVQIPLSSGLVAAIPSDTSVDGSVTVGAGRKSDLNLAAFRWTEQAGMELLGNLPTDPRQHEYSVAAGVSADGRVVVGESSSGLTTEAFRWAPETGLVGLGTLPGENQFSRATDVSSDGLIVVGGSTSAKAPSSLEAFRWTAEEGMVGLGMLDVSDSSSTAEFTSSDGRLVFGVSRRFVIDATTELTTVQDRSFVWDERRGLKDFVVALREEPGLSSVFRGWQDIRPTAISNNAKILVGWGTNPDGNTEAWLVRLDRSLGVPELESRVLALLTAALVVSCHPDKQFRGFHGTNHRAA